MYIYIHVSVRTHFHCTSVGMDMSLCVAGIYLGFVDIGHMVLDKGSDFVVKDFVGMNCHFEPHFEQFLPFQLWFEDQWLLLLPLL